MIKPNGIPLIGSGEPDPDESESFFQMLIAGQRQAGLGSEKAKQGVDSFNAAMRELFGGGTAEAAPLMAATGIIVGNAIAEYLWQLEEANGSVTLAKRRGRLAAVLRYVAKIADSRLENEVKAKRAAEAAKIETRGAVN